MTVPEHGLGRKGTTRKDLTALEVHRAELDPAKLAAMPERERVLLLLLAHASNELTVLRKLILMMRKDEPTFSDRRSR